MKKYPVKYVSKDRLKKAGVSLAPFPNAGPRANITGMKRQFWGRDAKCIKSGSYVYHVPAHIYDKF